MNDKTAKLHKTEIIKSSIFFCLINKNELSVLRSVICLQGDWDANANMQPKCNVTYTILL